MFVRELHAWAGKIPANRRVVFRVGILVAVLLAFPIYAWLYYSIPKWIRTRGGYLEVDLKALSNFVMDQHAGNLQDIPSTDRALDGKKVEMVGEMEDPQSDQKGDLTYFQLVYTKASGSFNRPTAQQFVDCNVPIGTHAEYSDSTVTVWGTMHVSIRKDSDAGPIKSIYHIDVERVEPVPN